MIKVAAQLREIQTQIPNLSAITRKLRTIWDNGESPLWTCLACLFGIVYPWNYILQTSHHLCIRESYSSGYLQAISVLILLSGPCLYDNLQGFHFLDHWQEWRKREKKTVDTVYRLREGDICTYARDIPDRLLETDREMGLTDDEVCRRQQAWGFNVPVHSPHGLQAYLSTMLEPAEICLTGVMVHAVINDNWMHAVLSLLNRILNLPLHRALPDSINDIQQSNTWNSSEPAIVLRNGEFSKVTAYDLVPGDIVFVSEGFTVPADAIVIRAHSYFYVDNPDSSTKRTKAREYMSRCTVNEKVAIGDGFLMVTKTGARTSQGRIADAFAQPAYLPKDHIDEIRAFAKAIFTITGGAFAFSATLSTGTTPWQDYLKLLANILVAAILNQPHRPYATTASLNAAAMTEFHMVENQIGYSVQTLAGVNVLCVGKFQSVTEDNHVFLEPICYQCTVEDLVLGALLTRSRDPDSNSRTDLALTRMLKRWPSVKAGLGQYKVIDWQWESALSLAQSLVELHDGGRVLYIRGSPYDVRKHLYREKASSRDSCTWLRKTATHQSRRGLDNLAVARKQEGKDWELLGVLPVLDKPRYDSSFAVKLARELGVSIKIFTTEIEAVTEGTARRIGLNAGVTTAKRALSVKAGDVFATADAIAECSFEDRATIIRHAREKYGYRVAAVANDPAVLESVECGINAKHGSERLAAAANMTLLQNGLCVAVNGIRVARVRFQWMYCSFCQNVITMLSVLLILCWHFLTYHQALDLRIWILGQIMTSVGNLLVHTFHKLPEIETEYSKQPMTWSTRSPLRESIPAVAVATFGALAMWTVVIKTVPPSSSSPTVTLAVMSQAMSLYLLIVDDGLKVLIKSGVTFWKRRNACLYLAAYSAWLLVLTAECATAFIAADVPLQLVTCAWVWTGGILTLCALWLLRLLTPHGPTMFGEDLLPMWPKYRSPADHL